MMIGLLPVAVLLSGFCLLWAGLNRIFAERNLIGGRLEALTAFPPQRKQGIEDELQATFKERVYLPMLQKCLHLNIGDQLMINFQTNDK